MDIDIHNVMVQVIPAILPVILAYFNNPEWPPVVKAIIPLVVCMVLATVEVLWTGQATGLGWLEVAGKAYAICMIAYAGFWKSPLVGWITGLNKGSEGNISDKVENNFGTGSR